MWGWNKVAYDIANESLVEVQKIREMYLTTTLQYLCYLRDKSYADKAQSDYEDQIRKAKSGR